MAIPAIGKTLSARLRFELGAGEQTNLTGGSAQDGAPPSGCTSTEPASAGSITSTRRTRTEPASAGSITPTRCTRTEAASAGGITSTRRTRTEPASAGSITPTRCTRTEPRKRRKYHPHPLHQDRALKRPNGPPFFFFFFFFFKSGSPSPNYEM